MKIKTLWERCFSINSQFCDAVVSCGYLSFEQMVSAAIRYRLGATLQRGVIFWQIDHEERIHDGKVMYYSSDCHRMKDKLHSPTWVSFLLARRESRPKGSYTSSHCLFGLHLLRESDGDVALVESEKTAFVMSEIHPQYIWLASGGLSELQPYKFRPLRGRRVILFPDTDPDGTAYRRWNDISTEVMASSFWEGSPPIRVSPCLEQKASPDQKSHKIDILDFHF